MAGQQLVLKLYNAIASSPKWDKILLVVVYDEHGGLYDHVPPPAAADDRPNFRRYGVRVPAFIISPWVNANSVSHVVFDHTSLIKTILLKFCRRADGSIPDMGARVTKATHLGILLTRTVPRAAPTVTKLQPLVANLAAIAGEIIIHANQKDGSGGNGQRIGDGLNRWGWPRLGGGLRWPVVRIGRLVRVLRSVSWLCWRILRLLLAGLLSPLLLQLVLLLGIGACGEAEGEGQCDYAARK